MHEIANIIGWSAVAGGWLWTGYWLVQSVRATRAHAGDGGGDGGDD